MLDGLPVISLLLQDQAERRVGPVLLRVQLQGCFQVLPRGILIALFFQQLREGDMDKVVVWVEFKLRPAMFDGLVGFALFPENSCQLGMDATPSG